MLRRPMVTLKQVNPHVVNSLEASGFTFSLSIPTAQTCTIGPLDPCSQTQSKHLDAASRTFDTTTTMIQQAEIQRGVEHH